MPSPPSYTCSYGGRGRGLNRGKKPCAQKNKNKRERKRERRLEPAGLNGRNAQTIPALTDTLERNAPIHPQVPIRTYPGGAARNGQMGGGSAFFGGEFENPNTLGEFP